MNNSINNGMIQKFVIEVEEMSADYEDEALIGWTTDSHRLQFFDSETDAEDVEVGLAESQDCDRKITVKRIGWVDVPACFRNLDDPNCYQEELDDSTVIYLMED